MFGEAKVWREGGEADRLRLGHLPCVDDFVGIICPAAMTSGHGCGALSEWIGAQCAESRRPPRVAVRPSSDGQAGRAACAMRSRNHRQFSIILPQFQFYNAPPRIVDRTSAQRSQRRPGLPVSADVLGYSHARRHYLFVIKCLLKMCRKFSCGLCIMYICTPCLYESEVRDDMNRLGRTRVAAGRHCGGRRAIVNRDACGPRDHRARVTRVARVARASRAVSRAAGPHAWG